MGSTYGTLTDNGATSVVTARGAVVFKASGTWGGGTITIARRHPNGEYKNLVTPDPLVSDDTGEVLIDFPPGTTSLLRATLAGATTPDLDWEFIGNVLPTNL